MNIQNKFLSFALLGAEWVLWLLVILSVISVAIMIERWRYFSTHAVDVDEVRDDLRRFLAAGDVDGAMKKYGDTGALETRVGLAGVKEAPRGHAAAEQAMISMKARHRGGYERNLAFLGTLGNNAPFIGLFGTVLGIIRAFKDLATGTEEGAAAVMAGISEALVATAVGIMVAIPAVMTFNYFQRKVRRVVAHSDSVAHALLAEMKGAA